METRLKTGLRAAALLLIPLAAVSLTGCGKKSVVGTWTGTMPTPKMPNMPAGMTMPAMKMTDTFRDDGTETMQMEMASPVAGVVGFNMTMNATYTFDGEKVTRKPVDVSINGMKRQAPPAQGQGAGQVMPVKLDGDTLTFTPPAMPGAPAANGGAPQIVLTRQK